MPGAPDIVDRLAENLMSLGVYVERGAREDDTVHVEYETAADGLVQNDIGNVCVEVVDAHGEGWEPRNCHFWAFDTDGGFHGEWELRAGWLRALDNGNISETDFSTLVLSTREPADDPPATVPAWDADAESAR
ncbi:hypothetical protein GJ631_10530 [Natronomonas sp. CBA1123]|jgi:hypothetical protein|uniref:hypothetical protein n=1 Tax=Natronomonas sp. CBA1123 TaxID=2668070 RepID=UPI0012EAEA34|nr:hypothetical protein [Natronomonas sp. CBA1123]MUV86989.1 hypothetical protein [Natronomonas sp. CBA1123]